MNKIHEYEWPLTNDGVYPGAVKGSLFRKGPKIWQRKVSFNNKYNEVFDKFLAKNLISEKTFEFYSDPIIDIKEEDMAYYFWKRIRISWKELLDKSEFYIESFIAGTGHKNDRLLRLSRKNNPGLKGFYFLNNRDICERMNIEVRKNKTAIMIFSTMAYNGLSSNCSHCSVLIIKNAETPEAIFYDPIVKTAAEKTPHSRILSVLKLLRVHNKLTIVNGQQPSGCTDCVMRVIIFIANYCDGSNIAQLPTRYWNLLKNVKL